MQSSEEVNDDRKPLVLDESSKSIFHLLDAEDEKQIVLEAQGRLAESLVYTIKQYNVKTKSWEDRDELTYAGIKHITIMMSQQHEEVGSLEVLENPIVKMEEFELPLNGEIKKINKWSCSLRVRNTKTGMVSPGFAEADVITKVVKKDPLTNKKVWSETKNAYEMEDGMDDFGRTKCVSKAFRNACKVQIPEKLILEMIKIAKEKGKTQTVETKSSPKTVKGIEYCSCSNDDIKQSAEKQPSGRYKCEKCNGEIGEGRQAVLDSRNASS